MNDDFNTPEALAVLFDLARAINRSRDSGGGQLDELVATLRLLGGRLGLLQSDPETYLRGDTAQGDAADDAMIDDLVAQRQAARERRDWAEADRLREQLTEMGIELEDAADGTRWRRA